MRAAGIINTMNTVSRHRNGYTSEEIGKTLAEIRDGLIKQMPRSPVYEGDGYDDKGELIYDTWYCPNCNTAYEADYQEYKYCPECGQRIDWTAREDEEDNG